MNRNWRDMSYLQAGNQRQQAAYRVLDALGIWDALRDHAPVLAGTVPLDVDVQGSDLDIICEAQDLEGFACRVACLYGREPGFYLRRKAILGIPAVIAGFACGGFDVEIFGQPRSVEHQDAYRHMVVEARLLRLGGPEARQEIRCLKEAGLKTEPAFAAFFGFEGDPYQALLALSELDDGELRQRLDGERPVAAQGRQQAGR